MFCGKTGIVKLVYWLWLYHTIHTIQPHSWRALFVPYPQASQMVNLVSRIVITTYHSYDSTICLRAPVWCILTWFTNGKVSLTDCDYILPSIPSVRFDHMIEGTLWCFPTCFTDGKHSFKDRDYMLPSVPSVQFDHMIEGPVWWLAICFMDGKHSFTDRDYMLPFVPSEPFDHMIEGPLWCFPTCFTNGKHSFMNRDYMLPSVPFDHMMRTLYDASPDVSRMVNIVSRIVLSAYHPYHPYDSTIWLRALYDGWPYLSRMVNIVSRIVITCYHLYHPYDSTIWLRALYDALPTCFTDGKLCFTDRDYTLPSVPSVRLDHTIESPYDGSLHVSRMVNLVSRIVTTSYHPYYMYRW